MTLQGHLYIRIRGNVQGPFSTEEIMTRARRGKFSRHYEVSVDGINWSRAAQFPELFPPAPPPKVQPRPATAAYSTPETYALREEQSAGQTARPADVVEVGQIDSKASPVAQQPSTIQQMGVADRTWYYSSYSQPCGPVSFEQLQLFAATGQLSPSEVVWAEGMSEWVEASRIDGLFQNTWNEASPVPGEPVATSAMAVASFVTGLLGVSLCFFLGSIAAVVFGHVALRQIQRNGETMSGRGMAVAGLVLGYLVIIPVAITGIVLLCLLVLGSAITG